MSASRMIVCTGNSHKVTELCALLPSSFALEPLPAGTELPPETGTTFLDNARIKARAGAELYPNTWIVADDSGIEIDALNGAPGVRSARWAADHDAGEGDQANTALVLHQLTERDATTAAARTARFRCVLVAIAPDGTELIADGSVEGTLADAPHGDHGFGYDPIFVPEGYELPDTFAALPASVKAGMSHRARAAADLCGKLAMAPHA